MPIRTGRNWKPAPTKSEPKLKRGIAMIGSLPITVIRRPSPVEISPLTIEPSTRPATIAMARTNSEKNSHGPNSRAIAASGPVTKIRNAPPRRPPKNDAQTPSQTARPGSPARAIGKPSKVVAIADGVPGMPMRHAVTSPPAEPPT